MLNRRVGCFIVILAMIAALLAYPAYWLMQSLPWRTEVRVSGKVVDGATGEPIADARVVVTLIRNGFPYQSSIGYGTITNEAGEFIVNTTSPRAFNDLSVEASSPDNKYAMFPYGKGAGRLRNGPVTLRLTPLPAKYDRAENLHYKHFCGRNDYNKWNPITFVGEGW